MSIQQLRERLIEFDDVEFSGPASEDQIAALQNAFSRPLPEDYLEYLRTFGSGAIDSEELVGLGGEKHLDALRVIQRLRAPSELAVFGNDLVPLLADGGGNYECIDLSRSTKTTSTVVAWNHGGASDGPLPIVGRSYWEWLSGLLDIIEKMDEEPRA